MVEELIGCLHSVCPPTATLTIGHRERRQGGVREDVLRKTHQEHSQLHFVELVAGVSPLQG
jgi:hypothetical protein